MDRTKSKAQFNSEEMRRFYQRFLDVRKLPVPVIAAINGPAIGAGYVVLKERKGGKIEAKIEEKIEAKIEENIGE
jgi:hypothetical protein